MRRARLLFTAVVTVSAATSLGCDTVKSKMKEALGADASAEDTKSPAASAGSATDDDYVACELLAAPVVTGAFPEVANVTFEDSSTLRDLDRAMKGQAPKKQPSEYRRETMRLGLGSVCTYSWPKPDAAEIRARNEAKSKELVAKTLSAKKDKGGPAGGRMAARSEMVSDRASVAFALVGKKPAATLAAARATYEDRIQTLRRGLKGTDIDPKLVTPEIDAGKAVAEAVKGIEVPPDTTLTDVAGIGDAAAWSAKSRTLHVLAGRHVFNVSIDARDEVNRVKAEAVAKAIVAAF